MRASIFLDFPLLDQVILGQVRVEDNVPVGVAGIVRDRAITIVEFLGMMNLFVLVVPIGKVSRHKPCEIKLDHESCIAEGHICRKVMPTDADRAHALPWIRVLIIIFCDNVFDIAMVIKTTIGTPLVHVVELKRMHEFLTDFYGCLVCFDALEAAQEN